MNTVTQLLVGVVLVGAGLILALGFPDTELGWFEGRPLGVVLGIIGVVDLGEAVLRRRRG
ncbi:hypothetical protein RB608_03885 [Nocardioides sp. LHD-245]|uniref:hypothetical protein n=1 Tax=Nocardioides sp. LHD-245 TaxID=3051387 RepID=UPI0027DFDEE5|nr:hypothetical protein [Nocardioides sp. LHD-245]